MLPPGNQIEMVRAFTRNIEFDYISWTLDAAWGKVEQATLKTSDYMTPVEQQSLVRKYLALVSEIQRKEAELYLVYSDPNIPDKNKAAMEIKFSLEEYLKQINNIGPLAEYIIQNQQARIIADLGLSTLGQPLPPVLYHSTPLPVAIIVSPRNEIRQDANISLIPGLTLDQRVQLENTIDKSLNVSSLIVGIGGVGVYPTMVMQTTDLNWLAEVVAHEWIHNYLSLRPLGINYMTSPELRTMNETAASIAGKELGYALIKKYYPDLLPPPQIDDSSTHLPQTPLEPPPFDFRAEMHETRLQVDRLLSERKISEAEEYMEERRKIFWENGYQIRKLNQAYFAFHGAYADTPTGAAGEDPVGEAVRILWAQSPNLEYFLNRISWMWSFDQLIEAIE